MDEVKAVISIGGASIQLEGPQEFVEKYLDQYQPLIERWHELPKPATEAKRIIETKPETARRKRTSITRPKGPSCGDRIRGLIDEDYFAEPRSASETLTWLKDQKSITYTINQVTASLAVIIKSGKLRRIKEAGIYKYMNP